jgi:hypothetical protein
MVWIIAIVTALTGIAGGYFGVYLPHTEKMKIEQEEREDSRNLRWAYFEADTGKKAPSYVRERSAKKYDDDEDENNDVVLERALPYSPTPTDEQVFFYGDGKTVPFYRIKVQKF